MTVTKGIGHPLSIVRGNPFSFFFSPLWVDDKVKTERELPPFLLGPDFKCQQFIYAHNEYFHLHGGIEFDISTPPVEDLPEEIKVFIPYCSTDTYGNMIW